MEPTTTQSQTPQSELTTLPVVTEYIGVRPGYCGGEPHILGHSIKVGHVAVWHEHMDDRRRGQVRRGAEGPGGAAARLQKLLKARKADAPDDTLPPG